MAATEPAGRTQDAAYLPKARRDARYEASFRARGANAPYFVQYLGNGEYVVDRAPQEGPLCDVVFPDARVLDLTQEWDKAMRERLLNGR